MAYSFEKHDEKRKAQNSYYGVSVNKSSNLGVAMTLARELKEEGWKCVLIEYDKTKKVIRLTRRARPTGNAVIIGWQHICADLKPHMPLGRYIVMKKTKDQYYLKYEQ